jgi:cellulose synthase/poly-beta-1,6-N-acetylglucosamine synthase-like glycosyltransferase
MLDLLFIPGAILYLLVVGSLFIYGINFFYLIYITLRRQDQKMEMPLLRDKPVVTVQLPIYNEMYVAGRLVKSAAGLDYPKESLEIQVLDDSTDETKKIVREVVRDLKDQGFNICLIHREDRQGYKAGALAHGLVQAHGEFFAIFDADFVPSPDFLERTLPYFQNPSVGFVQARWGHLNRDYSFLTYLQSLAIDAHFMVEQFSRSQAGYWFNFNGTAGIWRRNALEDAGGWRDDTLTEDLDLSYRAFFKGWRAVYLRDVEVPAELPASFSAYRRQQHRWARGSLECAVKYLPKIWSAPIPLAHKLEASLHLTGYGVHLLLCALVALYPLVILVGQRYPSLVSLFGIAFVFNATAFAPSIFFLVAQQQLGHAWWKKLPEILFITALGAGMMLNTLRAALQIIGKHRGIFERTPKFGLTKKDQNWRGQRYQLKLDRIVFFEIAIAGLNFATSFLAFRAGNWMIGVYAILFCCGLLFTSGLTIAQTVSVMHHQHKQVSHGQDISVGRGPAWKTRIGIAKSDIFGHKPADLSKTIRVKPFHVRVGQKHPYPQRSSASKFEFELNLEHAVLKTLAYADIFDYPLTAREIHRYLVGIRASLADIESLLTGTQLEKSITRTGKYFSLSGRQAIVQTRLRRSEVARQIWPNALRYGLLISGLPFVRMVAVTGALAVNNVEENADVDYLVVTEPGRLWVSRALIILLVRKAAWNGLTLCPNYLVTTLSMDFEDRNLYAAHELAQMIPVSGFNLYRQMRRINSWTDNYLPNAHTPPSRPYTDWISSCGLPGVFTKLQGRLNWIETGLRTPIGDWLEEWEMNRKVKKFNHKVGLLTEAAFCGVYCKGHFNNHGAETLTAYADRLKGLGVDLV